MGYLTTFTIYNDGLDQIKKNPEQVVAAICEAAYRMHGNKHLREDFSIGNHCNLISAQYTRHADDHTVYVHRGNCVTEMNAHSNKTKDICKRCPDFFDAMLSQIEDEIKYLKKMRDEVREE